MLRAEGLGALRILAAAIFDVLGFVQDDEGKVFGAVMLDVAAEDGVAGDEEIVLVTLGEFFGAVGAGEIEGAEMRGEARGFPKPVGDETGGADDQNR